MDEEVEERGEEGEVRTMPPAKTAAMKNKVNCMTIVYNVERSSADPKNQNCVNNFLFEFRS